MFLIPVIIFAILICLLYKYATLQHDFFAKRGIKFLKPLPLLGSNWRPAFGFASYFDFYRDTYTEFSGETVFGAFDLTKPVFMIRDLELVKQITIKNFDHFVNRRITIDVSCDPVGGRMMAFMHDDHWRTMRTTLSPAFTGNKMRYYFHLITECADRTMEYVDMEMEKNNRNGLKIETYDFFTRITNDLIASTAFGIEEKSFHDKGNEFYKLGRKLNEFGMGFFFKWMFFSVAPTVGKFLSLKMFDKHATDYFTTIIKDDLEQRNNKKFSRPDLLQIFLEADVPLEDIIGQSIQIFAAGFDTSAILFQFTAYELALHPEIQQKLTAEIDKVRENLKGKPLTYEIVQEMKYADKVIKESIRLHPALTWIERACTKPVTLTDSNGRDLHLEVGDHCVMPASGFHYDAKHFPDPEKFDPERFEGETNSAFMGFGLGPRKCMAGRLGIIQAKIFFYNILSKYQFEVNEMTAIPMKYRKGLAFLRADKDLWLDLKPRDDVL
ncbi:probable cytochrome P450 9f2 [Culicoides brevitarsis]|uniref:probable cytochrome P450 9f2 n=1 Tax=Culicoides brevitarsis TaxID=469753 RepID=UPI00307B9C52